MANKKLIDLIMEMIKANMASAKTEADYRTEPLQLPEEPKVLILNKTETLRRLTRPIPRPRPGPRLTPQKRWYRHLA